jgi:hypothetical protein
MSKQLKNEFPPSIVNLLLKEGQRWKVEDQWFEALGTGIIPIIGSARSGKTSLAYWMIDFVIKYSNRPIILDSFPQKVIDEGIPDHWKGRVSNQSFTDIATINEPALWLVDDTGAHFNSRSALESNNKVLARSAGILSHFGGGMTVIFTTQSLSAIDLSFLRFTTISPCIRWVDEDVIHTERKEWIGEVKHGNYLLNQVSKDIRKRDYFYSTKDKCLVKCKFPEFLQKSKDPKKADLMSRPMRYHTTADKMKMIGIKTKQKKKVKE